MAGLVGLEGVGVGLGKGAELLRCWRLRSAGEILREVAVAFESQALLERAAGTVTIPDAEIATGSGIGQGNGISLLLREVLVVGKGLLRFAVVVGVGLEGAQDVGDARGFEDAVIQELRKIELLGLGVDLEVEVLGGDAAHMQIGDEAHGAKGEGDVELSDSILVACREAAEALGPAGAVVVLGVEAVFLSPGKGRYESSGLRGGPAVAAPGKFELAIGIEGAERSLEVGDVGPAKKVERSCGDHGRDRVGVLGGVGRGEKRGGQAGRVEI